MPAASALSWSVLRALKHRIRVLLVSIVFISLPTKLLMPSISPILLAMVTVVALALWSVYRRISVRLATRALGLGQVKRAQRLYRVLWLTSLDGTERSACRLSLAACAASQGNYDLALRRVAQNRQDLDEALLAVSLNLQAYCLGREKRDMQKALQMAEQAIDMRPQVAGFRHTRGMLLLDLGRLDESGRELEATWSESDGNELLEAERCFDLGRLWSARGQSEYAMDYFERALRASPGSRWAEAARPLLVGSDAQNSVEAQL